MTLNAVATLGHTPGCTSWAMRVVDRGRPLDVLFACSVSVAGNRLVGNARYSGIVADFRKTFATLARTRADVVLPMHTETTDLLGRARKAAAGDRAAFVDPGLLTRITEESRAAFETELAKQQRAARSE